MNMLLLIIIFLLLPLMKYMMMMDKIMLLRETAKMLVDGVALLLISGYGLNKKFHQNVLKM